MWKDIKGWENYYEISSDGYVRNKITKKILTGDKNSSGYMRVCLYNKNNNPAKQRFFIHRLVAEHFIENKNNFKEVNHKDCDLNNNSINNLEWIDRKNNELHSRIYGSKEYKPFIVVYSDGNIKEYKAKSELANEIKVTAGNVKHWLHMKNNGYKKYNIIKIQYKNL